MPTSKFAFCVGEICGPRSAIWTIVSRKTDVYIIPVEAKCAKITLHLRTGEFSWGYTREFFLNNRDEIDERGSSSNAVGARLGRDFERWMRPDPAGAVTLPIRIYVANEALKPSPPPSLSTPVQEVTPRPGRAVGFVFLVVQEGLSNEDLADHDDLEFLWRTDFPELAESLVVLVHHIDQAVVASAANKSIIEFTLEHPDTELPEQHRMYTETIPEPATGSRNLIEIPTYQLPKGPVA